MKRNTSDLIKHSAIYGLGQILSRIASFLLLPIYTSYLRPADYGVIAILDLTIAVLGILVGSGMGTAVSRYHFDAKNDRERDQVWWTGLTFVAIVAAGCIILIWLPLSTVARITLGTTVARGEFYYKLVLPTLWFNVLGQILDSYLKVRKWSKISAGLNFVRLLFNICLNLYFLTILNMGITGILLGNLLTGVFMTMILFIVFSRNIGRYIFHRPMISKLWQFGWPLVGTALLSTVMHQADRYLLRIYLDMEQIGIYSFAYTIGQAINSLCLMSFFSIWEVNVYEISNQPNAKQVYIRVFEMFFYGLSLMMLAVSLVGRQILTFIADPAYLDAAELIPVVCLAYIFFSLHGHFRLPAMLAKRTRDLPPVYTVSAVVNIGANLLLIPLFGPFGAAWASVITFATFAFFGLWKYRQIDKYEYPLSRCGLVLIGMALSYVIYHEYGLVELRNMWSIGIGALIWLSWAILLFGPTARNMSRSSGRMVSKEHGQIRKV